MEKKTKLNSQINEIPVFSHRPSRNEQLLNSMVTTVQTRTIKIEYQKPAFFYLLNKNYNLRTSRNGLAFFPFILLVILPLFSSRARLNIILRQMHAAL